MSMKVTVASAAALATMLTWSASQAAPMFYSGSENFDGAGKAFDAKDDFLSATGFSASDVEDFEGDTGRTATDACGAFCADLTVNMGLVHGKLKMPVLTPPAADGFNIRNPGVQGRKSVEPDPNSDGNYVELWASATDQVIATFDFRASEGGSGPVNAFGLFLTDAGDAGSRLKIRLTNTPGGSGSDYEIQPASYSNSDASQDVQFFGLTDLTSFSVVELIVSSAPTSSEVAGGIIDGIGIDGIWAGSANLDVPEPATLALFGAGLLGLGAIRRRRKA